MIGAVAAVLMPAMEEYYRTEGGIPGMFITLWFIINTTGVSVLSVPTGKDSAGLFAQST